MPEDELEHLRTILARVHEPRKRKGIRTIVRWIANRFFTTPKKKMIVERVQNDPPKKDAA